MFRAALASAGAHEAAPRLPIQAILHPSRTEDVVRLRGQRRLYLGGLYAMRTGRLGRASAAVAVSAKASRTVACHRSRQDGHQLLENRPESPRRRLQHRLPEEHAAECEQKEAIAAVQRSCQGKRPRGPSGNVAVLQLKNQLFFL